MKSHIHTNHLLHSHSGWLNGIVIIFGYLWLISGIDKIGSGVFVSGFNDFVLSNYITDASYQWYVVFIKTVVLPYATFFGYLVEWGELGIGLALIVGAVWLTFRDSKIAHLVMAIANLGGAFLVLNIMLAEGTIFPIIDTSIVYEEGVSIDMIVFLVSMLVSIANLMAFAHEMMPRRKK
jgi:hypothetical protein